jgi:DNA-binding NtrC family response regulator
MPLETQAKVLRVLQERRLERVGGNQPIALDVRVVAATHRDLEAEVEAGRFREDLYYRLRVVTIELPPLRERRQDLPALAERFLTQVAERLGRPKKTLSAAALRALDAHGWPGNVRELRNVIEQAAVLADAPEIEADDIQVGRRRGPPRGRAEAAVIDLPFAEAKRQTIEEFERAYLVRALEAHEGNISRTAEAIGMVRQSLQQKLRELGIRARDVAGEGAP